MEVRGDGLVDNNDDNSATNAAAAASTQSQTVTYVLHPNFGADDR